MQKPVPEGGCLRDAFAQYERATGRRHPEDIPGDPLPADLQYLYAWFLEMHTGRPVSMAGYLPIPAVEIAAWCQLHQVKLRPWELGAIRAMDAAFLRVMAEK